MLIRLERVKSPPNPIGVAQAQLDKIKLIEIQWLLTKQDIVHLFYQGCPRR